MNNHLLSPDPQLDNELVQQFQKDLPQAMMLTADQVGSGRTASGLLRTICILASDAIDPTALGKWGPLVYDRTLPGGTLNDWMRFPWSAPQCVLLPGTNFTQARDGAEAIFHVACGLHASGVPAAVVARWPMGGASTAQVMKETMLEAPDLGVTLAWHRARALLWQSELRRDQELVPQEDTDETSCSGKEARFWASYLLLDGFRE